MEDIINHPNHYVVDGLECMDVIEKSQGIVAAMDKCSCDCLKYVFRHRRKGDILHGIEDMKKVRKYADMWLQFAEKCTDEELERYFRVDN